MSSRSEFSGKCGFCNAKVNLLRGECPKCGKPVHCQAKTVASETGGSWASTRWTCQRRARYRRRDSLYVCKIHNDKEES